MRQMLNPTPPLLPTFHQASVRAQKVDTLDYPESTCLTLRQVRQIWKSEADSEVESEADYVNPKICWGGF